MAKRMEQSESLFGGNQRDRTPCTMLFTLYYLPIGLSSMLDTVNRNDPPTVIDLIENAISAGPDPVSICISEFLYPDWSWVIGKILNPPRNVEDFSMRENVEILLCRRFKDYYVWHVSSDNRQEKYLFPLRSSLPPDRTCLPAIQVDHRTPDSFSTPPNPSSVFGCLLFGAGNLIFSLLSWQRLHANYHRQIMNIKREIQRHWFEHHAANPDDYLRYE